MEAPGTAPGGRNVDELAKFAHGPNQLMPSSHWRRTTAPPKSFSPRKLPSSQRRNVNLFQFAHFWVSSTSNLLGMSHVTPIHLPRLLSRMISGCRISFHDGELTCSHRMTNLHLDLTLHFSRDFHRLHLLRLFPCSRECSAFRDKS